MWPCKNISHIQVLGIYLLPTLSIQLKGLQIGGRLLVATHLDESNYLANQKQGAVNKYDLILFIRLFQGSSRAPKGPGTCAFFQNHSSLPVDSLDMTTAPQPRFLVQGHILSTSGNALRVWMSSLFITNPEGFAFSAAFCHSRAPSKFMFTKLSLGFQL
jgi:hypothetical protein